MHDTQGPDGSTQPLEFNTGMDEVPEAVDMAVRLMTPGETSLVRASPRYAFDGRAERPEVLHYSSGFTVDTPPNYKPSCAGDDCETSFICASPRYAFDGRAEQPEVLHLSWVQIRCSP